MAVLGMPLGKNFKHGSSPSRLSRDFITIPHHMHSPRQFRMEFHVHYPTWILPTSLSKRQDGGSVLFCRQGNRGSGW